jgi:hypothetical protein
MNRLDPMHRYLVATVLAVLAAIAPELAGATAPSWVSSPFPGLALSQGAPAADETSADTSLVTPPRKRTLLALSEVVGTNLAIWSYDRYIRQGGENPGFRIGFDSWEENFLNGFEWDDNNFTTNQFAHPYHGSMYFNAARSNGYDFWTSIPFTFAGSFLWEYMFETHHPSYNDWVNTSVGGTSLGEMLWRLSDLVLDNTATGSERRWREVAGLALDPMRGFTRLVTGENSRVYPNPPGQRPGFLAAQLDTGLRTVGQEELWDSDTTRVFLDVIGRYGDPFGRDRKKPFDSFDFGLQLNFADASVLAGAQAHGLLYATDLAKKSSAHHFLGFYLNYDYIVNSAYTIGGQSLAAAVQSRFKETALGEIQTQVFLGPVLLAGVGADYESYTGRSYDYGPGARAGLGVALQRNGRPWLQITHTQVWVHILNGTDGDHHLSLTRVRFDQPITAGAGIGAQYLLYLAESKYSSFEDVHHRFPEVRVFLSLPLE